MSLIISFNICANNKSADQPAHPCSLISTFVVHCLDSIILLVSISGISSLYLASVVVQTGLSLTCSQNPKTGFLFTRFLCISKLLTLQLFDKKLYEVLLITDAKFVCIFQWYFNSTEDVGGERRIS